MLGKSAIAEIGYFEDDTLAEDTDVTLKLLRKGHRVPSNHVPMPIRKHQKTSRVSSNNVSVGLMGFFNACGNIVVPYLIQNKRVWDL